MQTIIKDLNALENLCLTIKKSILKNAKTFKNQIFFFEAGMGSGKTTFIRSLVNSFDKELKVASPTFTGAHLYRGQEFMFFHYDLYQVPLFLEEFYEILNMSETKIIFIEWAEKLDTSIKKQFATEDTKIEKITIEIEETEARVFNFLEL